MEKAMSIREHWVISCDMRECQNQWIGHTMRAGRIGTPKYMVSARARKAGWGSMAIGKVGQKIHLCPTCRVALQKADEPEMFYRSIESADHSADHAVLLNCGHKYGKVTLVKQNTVDCTACFQKWLESGEIAGLPLLEDLFPRIVPET